MPSHWSHGTNTSARNCISTRTTPSPSQASQRPPGTLNEKWLAVRLRARASLVAANSSRIGSKALRYVTGIRPRRAADRLLIDEHGVADELRALELPVRADAPVPVALGALDRRVDHVVHERGLAGSAHARDRTVSRPSGISTSMFFRLCSVAPKTRSFCTPGRRRAGGTGIASSSRRYFAVSERGSSSKPGHRARVDHAAALLAGAKTEVDDLVGHANHVGVVLDDQHGVALVAQLLEDRDEPLVVARMQADRRLVEHIQRVHERRAERRREIDPLRLAARERRRQPIEREVVEADVGEEAEAPPDLAQDLVGDDGVFLRELQAVEEARRVLHGERADRVDRPVADAHVARLAPQPRAAAVVARQVAAITAQEHADVHLVLLALEPAEEPLHALVVAAAFDHELPLGVRQVAPRHVETQGRRLGGALELRETASIVRLGPRLDRAGVDRLGRIGHDERQIELDDVAEPVARRARAERVVEREQPRLRHFVRNAARPALEPLAEPVRGRRRAGVVDFDGERRAVALAKRRLDRVRQARAHVRRRPSGDRRSPRATSTPRSASELEHGVFDRQHAAVDSRRPKPRFRSVPSADVIGSSTARRAVPAVRHARTAARRSPRLRPRPQAPRRRA